MISRQHVRCFLIVIHLFALSGRLVAQSSAAFDVIPLGVKGGLDESDLSAYMLAPKGSQAYICLDAGTLYTGISRAIGAGLFTGSPGDVLKHNIKAYFISHGHLDHLAGLILNSPEDSAKPIYGMPYCLNILKDKYFTWASWANFGDAGDKPLLKKYHYEEMKEGEERSVGQTTLSVQAFPLSHAEPYLSTAFLIRNGNASLLYLGDTGADTLEHAGRLHHLWEAVAPLVKDHSLKALFIEVSFPDEQPEKSLFGHLTPHLLMGELAALAKLAGVKDLRSLPVVITHRKPSGDQESRIRTELEAGNPFHAQLIFPEQAVKMEF